jgi:rhamnulokinase
MRSFYAACHLAAGNGRVMLGSLHQDKLTISEVRRFPNQPIQEKDILKWDIPQLYQEVIAGLRDIGAYEEAVESVSCTSWPWDYLLFDGDGSLITPTHHYQDRRSEAGMQKVLSKIPAEALYAETGLQSTRVNTLFQLAVEKSRRLASTAHLLLVADAFNYLLCGLPRAELSLASSTQLYNPTSHAWSDRLLKALGLTAKILPPLVPGGTALGALREEIAQKTSLEDTRVLASCSSEMAAAVAGLPVGPNETWAFLQPGPWTVIGTELPGPILDKSSRQLGYNNEVGQVGAVRFSKQTPGLWILEECRRYWKEKDREIDDALLAHLAGSSVPFEALIDPADPRFMTPGDMPLKIQAVCRETGQSVLRKPGPIIRCVLESLALFYRKSLREIENLTGRRITHLYLLGGVSNDLLNHFIANAVHCSVAVAPREVISIGNVVVQALALGHLKSREHAREVIRNSYKPEVLIPHTTAWDIAAARFEQLFPS